MKKIITLVMACLTTIGWAQTTEDLFQRSDVKIRWLGIDFSHVKLIGDFSHFSGVGDKSTFQIKNTYFPAWNKLILNEREKYDVKGMLRKNDIFYDVDMIMALNDKTALEDLEAYNNPGYTIDDIIKFVDAYDMEDKTGIGIVLIAECLNKSETEAFFHFAAINMLTKEVMIHQRLRGDPGGFGIRNYWAGAIHDVMEQIESIHYRTWKSEFAKR